MKLKTIWTPETILLLEIFSDLQNFIKCNILLLKDIQHGYSQPDAQEREWRKGDHYEINLPYYFINHLQWLLICFYGITAIYSSTESSWALNL